MSMVKCYNQILLVPTLGRNRTWQWKIAIWNKIRNKKIIYSSLIKHGNGTSPIDRDLITFRRSSWNTFLDWRCFNLPTFCMDQRDLISSFLETLQAVGMLLTGWVCTDSRQLCDSYAQHLFADGRYRPCAGSVGQPGCMLQDHLWIF